MSSEILVCHLGTVEYGTAVRVQEQLRSRRQAGELPDVLLLLEHPPVYTAGRRAGAGELPFPVEFYAQRGIEVHETDRGGRITYHGPGQLVGYPIMHVEDVVEHLRSIEAALVAALGEAGVQAHGRVEDGPDYTGVWVAERKIASLGVHLSRGVSTHGFAVNVANDLEPFSWIVACGLPDVQMTSLALEAGDGAEGLSCFRKRVAHSFAHASGLRQRLITPRRLGIEAELRGPVRAGEPAGTEGPARAEEPARAEAPARTEVPA
ncbi:MAG: lipoyl(octanoyl) transferase LipB [Solirubrobacteraceae bacterium]